MAVSTSRKLESSLETYTWRPSEAERTRTVTQIRQRENNASISERSDTTASYISPNQTPPSLISLSELRCRKSASMSATLISPGGKAYALTHTKLSSLSRNLSSKPEFSRFSVIKFYVFVRLTLILLLADTSEQRVTEYMSHPKSSVSFRL